MIVSLKKYRIIRKVRSLLPVSISRNYRHYREIRNMLKKTGKFSQEEFRNLQFQKLKYLIDYCWNNIPGYRNHWEKGDFHPDNLKTLDDIKTIPFISKKILNRQIDAFSNKTVKNLEIQKTGGSTGIPFGFYQQSRNGIIEKAFIHDLWSRFYPEINLKTKATILRGRKIKGDIQIDPMHGLILSSYNLSPENISYFVKVIEKYKTPILHAYPSSLFIMARIMQRHNIKLSHQFESIMLGSEVLYDFQKETINTVFNSPICHWYGHAEKTVLAGNCEADDHLYIYPQYGITEIIAPSGKYANPGETGEIIGTGFWNFATPFIRYRTMDYAERGETYNIKCDLPYPTMSKIEGRQQELIIGKSSKLVTLTAVSLVCGKLSNIDQFKFYQRAIGQIVFHYVKIDPDVKIDEKQIIQSLQYILGDDFEITTQEVKKIPLTITGKLCYLDQQLEINEFIQ